MNTKGFKQMLIGEQMPDKDDPKYKERYERDVRAGRKFAKMCRIDKAAAKVQRFADLHKTMFLVIVFGFVGVSFSFNLSAISWELRIWLWLAFSSKLGMLPSIMF